VSLLAKHRVAKILIWFFSALLPGSITRITNSLLTPLPKTAPRVFIQQSDNSLWIKTQSKTKWTDYERHDWLSFMGLRLRLRLRLRLWLVQSLSIHLQGKQFTCVSTVRYLPSAQLRHLINFQFPDKLNTQNYTGLWNCQQAHHAYFHLPGWRIDWPTGGSYSSLGNNNNNNNNLLHSSILKVHYHTRLEGCNDGDHSMLKIPPHCC
jgi:hypothetical protein